MQIDFGDAKKEDDDFVEEEAQPDEQDANEFRPDFSDGPSGDVRRGTFVGTVNYLAPEMIKDSLATVATDLWALGCIIFKMHTGKVPFPGMSETAVFPSILNRQIDWPKDFVFDKDMKDLID